MHIVLRVPALLAEQKLKFRIYGLLAVVRMGEMSSTSLSQVPKPFSLFGSGGLSRAQVNYPAA